TCSNLRADGLSQGPVTDATQPSPPPDVVSVVASTTASPPTTEPNLPPDVDCVVTSRTVSPPTMVESGPHHRLWQYATADLDDCGGVVTLPHSHPALVTGMNRW